MFTDNFEFDGVPSSDVAVVLVVVVLVLVALVLVVVVFVVLVVVVVIGSSPSGMEQFRLTFLGQSHTFASGLNHSLSDWHPPSLSFNLQHSGTAPELERETHSGAQHIAVDVPCT